MQLVLRLGADENMCDGATDLIYPTHFSMDLICWACLSVFGFIYRSRIKAEYATLTGSMRVRVG